MAYGYEWLIRELFPCAIQIADKFHVIKHALDALQDVRVRYRQKLLTKRRKAYEMGLMSLEEYEGGLDVDIELIYAQSLIGQEISYIKTN